MKRRLLAIESATDWLSVALLEGEGVLAERSSDARMQHAAALLPAIDAILCEVDIGIPEIDAIAISTGPGSFTSLRIGLATVKGLGFRRDLRAVGVSTLEAMALSGLEGDVDRRDVSNPESEASVPIVALLDARRGEWYAGGWRGGASVGEWPNAWLAEGLYAPDRLASSIEASALASTPESKGPIDLVAPQRGGWCSALEERGIGIRRCIEGEAARPHAVWVGRLGGRRIDAGEAVPVRDLGARYLRRAEAEAKRLGGPVEAGELADVGP